MDDQPPIAVTSVADSRSQRRRASPFRHLNLYPVSSASAHKMRQSVERTLFWIGLFLVLAVAPLLVVSLEAPAGRGFWIEFGSGLGIVGFALLALQFFTTARFRHIATFFGSDSILLFHKCVGVMAFFVIVAHPVVLIIRDPAYLEYLDVRVNAPRTIFLTLAMIGLVLLVVLPLWRLRFGLSYEWWRITHAVFAAGVLLVAIAHSLQVGHYVRGVVTQGLWLGIGGSAFMALLYVRILKPWYLKYHPYRVTQIRDEHGEVWTLVLEPEGHAGFSYQGGQYGWLTLGDSPFTLQQHPFSFSSSSGAAPRVEITIKASGDFTRSIATVKPGTRAFLEGPFGSFTLEAQRQDAAVFVMGGIGVTPAISILRSCRDRGDRRPLTLIYANNTWEEIAFREELDDLSRHLNLTVVHVINKPPEGWSGESGYVNRKLLERYAPCDGRDRHFFVCGPLPMMDAVETALAEMQVPIWNRSIERFQIV